MPKLILKLKITSVLFTPVPQNFGDMQVFTDDITEINGKPLAPGVSQHSGFCFVVREPNTWLCQAGYSLPGIRKRRFRKGGQIQARALLDISKPVNRAAITGGTGDYRRASGDIKLDGNNYTLTIFTP